MTLEHTPICEFGWSAPEFDLPGTDGQRYTFAGVEGPKGTLVMFICNHCPYVKAVLPDIIRDVRELAELGVGAIAIMPNDTTAHPDDSLDNMKRLSDEMKFPFPYVIDRSQGVARAYGAVCTPDFFGFGKDRGLQYRGRIVEMNGLSPAPGATRDLYQSMRGVDQEFGRDAWIERCGHLPRKDAAREVVDDGMNVSTRSIEEPNQRCVYMPDLI